MSAPWTSIVSPALNTPISLVSQLCYYQSKDADGSVHVPVLPLRELVYAFHVQVKIAIYA
jgi:hypothetical protein